MDKNNAQGYIRSEFSGDLAVEDGEGTGSSRYLVFYVMRIDGDNDYPTIIYHNSLGYRSLDSLMDSLVKSLQRPILADRPSSKRTHNLHILA